MGLEVDLSELYIASFDTAQDLQILTYIFF